MFVSEWSLDIPLCNDKWLALNHNCFYLYKCDAIWENLSDVAKQHFEIERKLAYNSIELLNNTWL